MYEDFYGLTGKPFQLSPDPAFYFGSKGHSSAFSYLKYGVYQGEGFLVITGDIGTGKTTLVRALLDELDTGEVVAAQIVNTQLDADDLLRSVATAFGINVGLDDSKAHLLATIEAFLLTTFQRGKRALLIVDEAQNLGARSLEELRMLSNFQCGDNALLQSFLVGQPELRMLMRSPLMEQFRQRVIASYHLGPLDQADTRAYIEHRLRFVGWKGDPQFEDDAFVAIHKATGGVPRRINSLCNRVLLAAYLNEQHLIGRSAIAAAVAEMTSEMGVDIAVQPALGAKRDAAATAGKRESATTGGSRIGARPLAAITERIEQLEHNVEGLLSVVRGIVEPERALPDEETRGSARSSKGR
ncbi:MAG TPA: XrtA/PEP-CTERM system-associated ATPase [Burkholderiaceae bacterium]|nr:XrtA/PEP-CTERM system-associated ATPase [Burkholderiaceae bacterium]